MTQSIKVICCNHNKRPVGVQMECIAETNDSKTFLCQSCMASVRVETDTYDAAKHQSLYP